MEIQHTITYAGRHPNEDWEHFKWYVTIGEVTFEYRTGLGHCTPERRDDGGWNKKPDLPCIFDKDIEAWVHVPKIEDVLDCLFMDADMGAKSFDDFCFEFGYSNDSIKAFDTYRTCMKNGKKLRKALGPKYNEVKEYIEKKREAGEL